MRTREDTDYGAVSHSYEQDTWNGSSATPVHTSGTINSYGAKYSYRMDDVVTHEFQSRQRRGVLTFSPMESARSLISAQGQYDALVHSYVWQPAGNWGFPRGYERHDSNYLPFHRFPINTPLAQLVHTSNTDNTFRNLFGYGSVASQRDILLSRLHAKLSDSDAMIGVTAYEAPETARMITRAAKMAYRTSATFVKSPRSALRDLAKMTAAEIRHVATDKSKVFRRKSQVRAVTKLASQWLQLRYGWQSLFYEFQDYTTLSPSDKTMRRSVVSGSDIMSQYTTSSSGTRDADASYGTRVSYEAGNTYARHTTLSAGAMYRMSAPLAPIDAVGARRVFSSMWEIVPFSFVIDWFVNVSDKIASLDTALLCDILGTWYTTRHTLSWTRYNYGIMQHVEIPNYWKCDGYYNNNCNINDICDHVIREANPGVTGSLSLNIKLNTTRVIDAVSLLKVNSRKISRLLKGI